MASISSLLSKGSTWINAQIPSSIREITLTSMKVGALMVGILAVGGIVVTIATGSLPAVTMVMIARGAIELPMAALNLTCCMSIFRNSLHSTGENSQKAFLDVAGKIAVLAAIIFVTNFIGIGFLEIFDGSVNELLKIAGKAMITEIGLITNFAMGIHIFRKVKDFLCEKKHEWPHFNDMIQKVVLATIFILGMFSFMNFSVLAGEMPFRAIGTITATFVGSAISFGFCAKIWQIVKNSFGETSSS